MTMHDLLSREAIAHLQGIGANVIDWAFGLCLPLRWPRGEVRYSEPIIESAAAEEQPLPLIEPAVSLEALLASSPVPEFNQPPRPAPLDPDRVMVKVLQRREIGGKVQFFAQEEGKPRGVLAYGVPPAEDQLPKVGDEIAVFPNNQDERSPQYRGDKKFASQSRPKGGPRGK